jgi:hypothetical protein
MRTSEAFPSKYLKKEDLNGKRVLVTIDRVEVEDVGQGEQQERKPVVYFDEYEKGLVLNKGNADAMTEAAGGDDEMDNWRGVRVVLYVDANVMFAGKRVGGLRVTLPAGNAKPKKNPLASTAGVAQHDDEPPFPTDDDAPPPF